MPTNTWKAHERRIAKALGGSRVLNTGAATPDIVVQMENIHLVVECKVRKQLPALIQKALKQISQHRTEQTFPIVVLHKQGAVSTQDVVCLTLSDFKILIDKWEE